MGGLGVKPLITHSRTWTGPDYDFVAKRQVKAVRSQKKKKKRKSRAVCSYTTSVTVLPTVTIHPENQLMPSNVFFSCLEKVGNLSRPEMAPDSKHAIPYNSAPCSLEYTLRFVLLCTGRQRFGSADLSLSSLSFMSPQPVAP